MKTEIKDKRLENALTELLVVLKFKGNISSYADQPCLGRGGTPKEIQYIPNISGSGTGFGVGRGGIPKEIEYIPNISGSGTQFGMGRGEIPKNISYITINNSS